MRVLQLWGGKWRGQERPEISLPQGEGLARLICQLCANTSILHVIVFSSEEQGKLDSMGSWFWEGYRTPEGSGVNRGTIFEPRFRSQILLESLINIVLSQNDCHCHPEVVYLAGFGSSGRVTIPTIVLSKQTGDANKTIFPTLPRMKW